MKILVLWATDRSMIRFGLGRSRATEPRTTRLAIPNRPMPTTISVNAPRPSLATGSEGARKRPAKFGRRSNGRRGWRRYELLWRQLWADLFLTVSPGMGIVGRAKSNEAIE